MGLGNAQFFDNNGAPLTAGVLYSYQAGTTSQLATYTDASGTTVNPNPIPFGSGARVGIWLSTGSFYKFVLCVQNDGPSCAPADVIFSVDQVPGSPIVSSSGSTFTGIFISSTANPATTGILRLASPDTICWRNQANSANLCISKDANDVLAWAGGTVKFPEGACSNNGLNFDYLCPDSSTHHFKFSGNGSSQFVIPGISTAGIAGNFPKFDTNGLDLVDSSIGPPVSTSVTFSSTPTFTVSSTNQLFQITLTGAVASSTLTVPGGTPVPSLFSLEITQDATGGRTFVFPPNVLGAYPISTAPNAVTMEHFVWDGMNARAALPLPASSFNAPQRVVLGGNQAVTSTTQTTILTETVTFPSATGTYRADVRYNVWMTTGANVCAAQAIDTTNNRAFAGSGQNANGSGFVGLSGSELSSQSYTAGATATFTLQVECNANTTATVNMNNGSLFTMSPASPTFLSVTPVLSN